MKLYACAIAWVGISLLHQGRDILVIKNIIKYKMIWSRRIAHWGRQNVVSLPHEFLRRNGWMPGDALMLAETTKNILTITRVPAGQVPESVLDLASRPGK